MLSVLSAYVDQYGWNTKIRPLYKLEDALNVHYLLSVKLDDMTQTIKLHQTYKREFPVRDHKRIRVLGNLGNALRARGIKYGSSEDLAEAVRAHRGALELCPLGHGDRFNSLNNVAQSLMDHGSGIVEARNMSLKEAVSHCRESLVICPPNRDQRSKSFSRLADALMALYQKSQDQSHLEEAVRLARESRDLCPRGHHQHIDRQNNLGNLLMILSEKNTEMQFPEEAAAVYRIVLESRPRGHPERVRSLIHLGNALLKHGEKSGSVQSMTEALNLYRRALKSRSPSGTDDAELIKHLGTTAQLYVKTSDNVAQLPYLLFDLVSLYRGEVESSPQDALDLPELLGNLGIAFRKQGQLRGNVELLSKAVSISKSARDLRLLKHPRYPYSVLWHASSLTSHGKWSNNMSIIREGIELHRLALDLALANNIHDLDDYLTELAYALAQHGIRTGDIHSLEEAISLEQRALDICSPSHSAEHLNALGRMLTEHGERSGDVNKLSQAIVTHQKALIIESDNEEYQQDLEKAQDSHIKAVGQLPTEKRSTTSVPLSTAMKVSLPLSFTTFTLIICQQNLSKRSGEGRRETTDSLDMDIAQQVRQHRKYGQQARKRTISVSAS